MDWIGVKHRKIICYLNDFHISEKTKEISSNVIDF